MQKFAHWRPRPPARTLTALALLPHESDELMQATRDIFRVIVISWAIKVCRHQAYRIKAILLS